MNPVLFIGGPNHNQVVDVICNGWMLPNCYVVLVPRTQPAQSQEKVAYMMTSFRYRVDAVRIVYVYGKEYTDSQITDFIMEKINTGELSG